MLKLRPKNKRIMNEQINKQFEKHEFSIQNHKNKIFSISIETKQCLSVKQFQKKRKRRNNYVCSVIRLETSVALTLKE